MSGVDVLQFLVVISFPQAFATRWLLWLFWTLGWWRLAALKAPEWEQEELIENGVKQWASFWSMWPWLLGYIAINLAIIAVPAMNLSSIWDEAAQKRPAEDARAPPVDHRSVHCCRMNWRSVCSSCFAPFVMLRVSNGLMWVQRVYLPMPFPVSHWRPIIGVSPDQATLLGFVAMLVSPGILGPFMVLVCVINALAPLQVVEYEDVINPLGLCCCFCCLPCWVEGKLKVSQVQLDKMVVGKSVELMVESERRS